MERGGRVAFPGGMDPPQCRPLCAVFAHYPRIALCRRTSRSPSCGRGRAYSKCTISAWRRWHRRATHAKRERRGDFAICRGRIGLLLACSCLQSRRHHRPTRRIGKQSVVVARFGGRAPMRRSELRLAFRRSQPWSSASMVPAFQMRQSGPGAPLTLKLSPDLMNRTQ